MRDTVGARERVLLPDLGLGPLTARIDTGARTAALHVTRIHVEGSEIVFSALDEQGTLHPCRAPLLEWRWLKDSGGHPTLRPVIATAVIVGGHTWVEEVTLADREGLRHRMLLGRRALAGRFVVDVAHSFVQGRPEGKA